MQDGVMVRMEMLEIRASIIMELKKLFLFLGFGDITFSFAPFMLPLAFSMLCFFATDLPPFFSPLCLLLFLSLALC